jgi:hypothetical protein
MCAPAVRTLLLVARPRADGDGSEDDDGAGAGAAGGYDDVLTHVLPVLALKSEVFRHYLKAAPAGRGGPAAMLGTEEEAAAQGWRMRNQHEVVRPVFIGSGGGLLCERVEQETGAYGTAEFVAAPWPPEEDEQRLAPVMERLVVRAREAWAETRAREEQDRERGWGPEAEPEPEQGPEPERERADGARPRA